MRRAILTGLLTIGSLVNLLMLVLHHVAGTSVVGSLWLASLIVGVGLSGVFQLRVRRT
ncbi:MAG: hypothetical protein L0154_26470 [Chloroflexi bacterium]|nr:hypothetical protein [Chloroflexota bacterium]